MPLQLTGEISLANIQTEFGGSNPISLSEYYSDGIYVPNSTIGYPGGVETTIPVASQKTISLANFYGSANRIKQLYTFTFGQNWTVPAGMTSAIIYAVGGGGKGGGGWNAGREAVAAAAFSSGGGGGAGEVKILTATMTPGTTVSISIGAGSTVDAQQGGTTSVSIPGFGTANAVGGYSGTYGVYADGYIEAGGRGGASGNGFSGFNPGDSDVFGGGGGGATSSASNATPGSGYTVTLGGTTFYKGEGGWGDGGGVLVTPANSGNGGTGRVNFTRQSKVPGYAGGSGIVIIYG